MLVKKMVLYLKTFGRAFLRVVSVIIAACVLGIIIIAFGGSVHAARKRGIFFFQLIEDVEGLIKGLIGIILGSVCIIIGGLLLCAKCFVWYTKHFATAILKREERLKGPIVFWKEFLIREGFGKKKSQGQYYRKIE